MKRISFIFEAYSTLIRTLNIQRTAHGELRKAFWALVLFVFPLVITFYFVYSEAN